MRMVPAALLWAGGVAIVALTLLGIGTATLVPLTIVGLGCVALVPLAGWLRLLSFLPVAAAGTGAIAAAVTLEAGQAVPVVLAAATVAGALTGAGVMALSVGDAAVDSVTSVVAAVAVWGLALPAVGATASSEVVLFGVDLSSDRALALVALLLVAAAAWGTHQAGQSRFASGAKVLAASPATAARFGIDGRRTRLEVGMIAGGTAGWAGLVLTLDAQALPSPAVLAPAIGVLWLGAALLGGRSRVPTALLGAVLVGGVAPALGLAAPAAAGIAVVIVATARRDGLGEVLRSGRGSG